MNSVINIGYEAARLFLGGEPIPVGSGSSRGHTGPFIPPSSEQQREFQDLFARLGVHRRRDGNELVHCPWHQDDHESLSVDWANCRFHCFAPSCAAHPNPTGIRRLRDLVGVDQPQYRPRRHDQPRRDHHPGPGPARAQPHGPDLNALRRRLADGIERLQGWEKARALRECRARLAVHKCPQGDYPAFLMSCGNQLCPRCGPRRLARDWYAKLSLPDGLRLYDLRSLTAFDGEDLFGAIRQRFAKWRHAKLINAVYGVRLERTQAGLTPRLMAILPPGETLPDGGRAFEITEIAADATAEEALQWFQDQYLDESDCWQSENELSLLLSESKKRRRFQCFGLEFQKGGSYALMDDGGTGTDDQQQQEGDMGGTDSRSLGRKPPPSGGAGHVKGPKRAPICPVHGCECDTKPMFTVSLDDVRELPDGKGYIWKGPK